MLRVEPARESDLPELEQLLDAALLPLDGLRDQFPSAYVIARDGGAVIGAAGMEVYGDAGLLRSVVVIDKLRGSGIGAALVADRLAHASRRGMRQVFLLTTTAADYFKKRGFQEASRAAAPPALAASVEFAVACPASAICLVWRANPEGA